MRAVVVRVAVLGAALVLYTLVVSRSSTDALGAGLIAFAGLVLASGAWSLVDGLRHGARTALGWWVAVAVALALGWWVAFAATQQDSSLSFTDLLTSDAGFIPFVMALVLVPAAAGALLGAAIGRARRG